MWLCRRKMWNDISPCTSLTTSTAITKPSDLRFDATCIQWFFSHHSSSCYMLFHHLSCCIFSGEFVALGLTIERVGGLFEVGKCECHASETYPSFLNFPAIEANQVGRRVCESMQ